MKWFMSYAQVYKGNGCSLFGHTVTNSTEHPIEIINGWNERNKDSFQCVLLSFQQVDDKVPDSDVLSDVIS